MMALDGRGLAWLPETLIGDDMAAGRLVNAASNDWRIALKVRLYRDRIDISRAAEAFWDAASSYASG
jgi:DNA-binding transcriptional LysR family regulator